MPDRLKTWLKYTETLTFQCAVNSAVSNYLYRLNSIYDPNYSAAGHQPYGRDQFATLYSYYKVLGCKWNLQFIPNAYNYAPVSIAVATTNESAGGTTSQIDYYQERPGTRQFIFRENTRTVKGYASIPRIIEVSPRQYSSSAYRLSQTSDPADPAVAYLRISNACVDASTQPYFTVKVNLHYLVEYTDFIVQASS